jgi:hypothetical protein
LLAKNGDFSKRMRLCKKSNIEIDQPAVPENNRIWQDRLRQQDKVILPYPVIFSVIIAHFLNCFDGNIESAIKGFPSKVSA